MRVVVFTLLMILIGCANQKNTQQNRFGDLGHQATEQLPPRRAPVIEEPEPSNPVHLSSTQSQNAAEQAITGIGANIGKLTETMEASLVRIDSRIDSLFKANIDIHNSVAADLRASIRAEFSANTQLSANAIASLETRLTAHVDAKFQALANTQAQAIAGFNNSIQSMQQNVGNGSNVNNYADQMFKANQTSDRATMWIVIAMSLGWIATSEMSRLRAERRHREATGKGEKKCDVGFIRRSWRSLW